LYFIIDILLKKGSLWWIWRWL